MVAHSLREVSARAGSTWEEQRRQQQAQRPLLLLAVAPLSAFNVPALAQHARQHLDAAMRLLLTAEPPAAILA